MLSGGGGACCRSLEFVAKVTMTSSLSDVSVRMEAKGTRKTEVTSPSETRAGLKAVNGPINIMGDREAETGL